MAKQARAHATRETIIRAAGVVFASQNYSTATLAEVIDEAGVTQGALYFHFDSKHHLALELIKKQHELSLDGSPVLAGIEFGGLKAMVLMSRDLARQITTNPIIQGGLRLSTESSELFPEYVSKPYLDWIATCVKYIDVAIADGDVRPSARAQVLARYIMSTFTGVQVVSQVLTQWRDLFERLEEMWELILDAIVLPERRAALGDLPSLVRESDPK